jgi:hypothetical protein
MEDFLYAWRIRLFRKTVKKFWDELFESTVLVAKFGSPE